ncbi:GTPase HflX [Oceanirhabdus sp. W0125-5]|uniref:GTPase HflX n=1 Tax=Oceanirhabdus sp. W0125-5 TaxID=2999116 RepID=UPI0022F2C682|nr:GTPase HflX [Oceanirhabdus sp. W0125-5]WBW96454.1 GTPase HflX [Oceanirhabdus sp. W0125-5]
MIKGKTNGIKFSVLNKLEELKELNIERGSILSQELVERMNKITNIINREISVAIDRRGNIIDVTVGDSKTVELPAIDTKERRLSGVRIIHTHPKGNSKLSALDISALMELKLDAMVAIGVQEIVEDITVNIGFCDVYNKELTFHEVKNISVNEAIEFDLSDRLNHINKIFKDIQVYEEDIERAILVGIDNEESLEELEGLAEACGVVTVEKVLQKKNKVDSAFYAGRGKVQEIAYLRQAKSANVVIFDDELSSSQVRNLEEQIGCKIIDRTILILDIFARRAKSREAKLQVELAMLRHRLSRLRGFGADLARIRGGVGTKGGVGSRGPGEKKLETDRRHIADRIDDIKNELEKVIDIRAVQRENRNRDKISKVSLVGYTNAGKSTLRNKLCEISSPNHVNKSGVFEADMLFATLDTTVRAINLKDNRKIALSDTVGFIRKLPHELVEAFKSTLEEVIEADLLLHVVDASNEEALEQIIAVNNVLDELDALGKNSIIVLNKIDVANEEDINLLREELKGQKIVEISAVNEINLDKLLDMIGEEIPVKFIEKEFVIPYDAQALVSMLHERCNILCEDYKEEGTYIKAEVYEEMYNKCKEFEVK